MDIMLSPVENQIGLVPLAFALATTSIFHRRQHRGHVPAELLATVIAIHIVRHT
jgi:hypothetical protein